jgi:hypothetical protein
VQNALPPRFQRNAQWCANLVIINTLRQFETTNGALKFPSLQDNPPLLGRPMNELSNMDGAITHPRRKATIRCCTATSPPAWSSSTASAQPFELVPHLFGASRRPTGQRGALLWFRTGSDVVIPMRSGCFRSRRPPSPDTALHLVTVFRY